MPGSTNTRPGAGDAASDTVDVADGKPARPWFVYLIECRDGSLYTGIAVDVSRRYRDHETGKGARYTRSHPPRRLAAVMACMDRSSALRTELAVKRLRSAEKRVFCLRNPPPTPIES